MSTPGASSSANQDLNELPKGSITQAHAKHFLEAILASNAKPWFETRANAYKISLKQLSKGLYIWRKTIPHIEVGMGSGVFTSYRSARFVLISD
ncbi:hypothetical protein GOBAR_AA31649 [Gossypium barbadense]|uniref:Uncharacterized protein n=1 Tax=Gossypium barbadense TaxID=3634 RepID=A0A2P5WD64_GOSBA|nr:hypothetical protein GOBAR_AA31649 [Gossypium barbadense]